MSQAGINLLIYVGAGVGFLVLALLVMASAQKVADLMNKIYERWFK